MITLNRRDLDKIVDNLFAFNSVLVFVLGFDPNHKERGITEYYNII
jgi:hypothetical protein